VKPVFFPALVFPALALLLLAGCLVPGNDPGKDPAALKAEALALAKEDPLVFKLTRFAGAFNDPTLREVLSPEQDKVLYDLKFEVLTWGENRFKVTIHDSVGGKENEADLWLVVDLKARQVVEYSSDLRPDSPFMTAVSQFLFAPDAFKVKSIVDAVSKFVPIESCEQWGGERDMCYGFLATSRNNPYICDEITGFDGKFTCVAAVTKNQDRCNAVNSENQATCHIFAITLTKHCLDYDPVKHGGEEASLQDRCLGLLPDKATAFGPSLCDLISDSAYKARCLQTVAFNHADNEACDSLEGMNKKACRALALRDPKYCRKTDDSLDEGCLVLLAKKSKDAELCSMLSNADNCYREVGVAKQDQQLCAKISSQNASARRWCYTFTSQWKPSKGIKGYIPFTSLLPSGIGRPTG